MSLISKESIETLKEKVDLVELLQSYLSLKRSGSTFKALCPFHEEKSPSFMVQMGQKHYHCFGCGAHGDAIEFVMHHLGLSFADSVRLLADRFGVTLQEEEKEQSSIKPLRLALQKAVEYYHFFLLHTEEGHKAMRYLYQRGFTYPFIRKFHIGWAPKKKLLERYLAEEKIEQKELIEAGLLKQDHQKTKEFFIERVMIPIYDSVGSPIGFTGRRLEDGWGPKYVNTPETLLFKKSKLLFGLNYSRRRIIKEKKVLLVEGQLDALRLIFEGFDWTVACQGTAFTESHVKELLQLGVQEIVIAMDSDTAGQEAAEKVGHLFQKEGVEVTVIGLPDKMDPDTILCEQGKEHWQKMVEQRMPYITFLVEKYRSQTDLSSPAQKNSMVQKLLAKVHSWDHPLMVHESIKKISQMLDIPPEFLTPERIHTEDSFSAKKMEINFQAILEEDFLRWIFLMDRSFLDLAEKNIDPSFLHEQDHRFFYQALLKGEEDVEEEYPAIISSLLKKKVPKERARTLFFEAIQKLLDRKWMEEREKIKQEIYLHSYDEERVTELVAQFDYLKKNRPQIVGEEEFVR